MLSDHEQFKKRAHSLSILLMLVLTEYIIDIVQHIEEVPQMFIQGR